MEILDSHSLYKNGAVNTLSVDKDKLKQWMRVEMEEVDSRKNRKTIPCTLAAYILPCHLPSPTVSQM